MEQVKARRFKTLFCLVLNHVSPPFFVSESQQHCSNSSRVPHFPFLSYPYAPLLSPHPICAVWSVPQSPPPLLPRTRSKLPLFLCDLGLSCILPVAQKLAPFFFKAERRDIRREFGAQSFESRGQNFCSSPLQKSIFSACESRIFFADSFWNSRAGRRPRCR